MIIEIAHIRTADNTDFVDKLRTAIIEMQNECELDIEVQYQTTSMEDGYSQYVVYSAIVIGREIKVDKAGVAPRAEVAREIFEEIEDALESCYDPDVHADYPSPSYGLWLADRIAELKKEYTCEEDEP